MTTSSPPRRHFLRHTGGLLVAGAALSAARPALANLPATRSLAFSHTHTGEQLALTYAIDARYLPDSLAAFNLLLWGIGLASGGPRGGNNWVLMVALLGFVVYFNLVSLSQAWVGDRVDSIGAVKVSVMQSRRAGVWRRKTRNCALAAWQQTGSPALPHQSMGSDRAAADPDLNRRR